MKKASLCLYVLALLSATTFAQRGGALGWSGVNSYQKQNEQLAPPTWGERRVVFMGDSITQGWRLEKAFPGKPYINRGISGQTTFQMLIRFQTDVVELRPRAVLILAGTNDLGGNDGPTTVKMIEQNLMSMVQIAQANRIKVIFASILPRKGYELEIFAINKWIQDVCKKNQFVYLDYYSKTKDDKQAFGKEYSGDGLHPNQAGYEVMAPLAEAAITVALTEPNLNRSAMAWSSVGRFQDKNTAIPEPQPEEKRVVFMGDSITQGWSLSRSFGTKPYINRGISGNTTFQMLIRYQSDVIALKPKAVVILAGTNDIGGNDGPTTLTMVEQNLASMAEIAAANNIKVVLASILPRGPYSQEIEKLNSWIKQYAKQNHHIYLDYYSSMVDEHSALKFAYGSDGVHPNDDGYAVMAPLAAKAIAEACP